nr:methyltransferase domain-containing protein [Roseibium hamelinense]
MGGTLEFWNVWNTFFDYEKLEIVCVNLPAQSMAAPHSNVRYLQGNACDLSDFEDKAFEVAFSNSVIEHVGSWANMQRFANETARVAKSYFVQTPNFWFPVEPHARLPIVHWLPNQINYRIHMATKAGFYAKAANVGEAMVSVEDAELLDARQMAYLFPDADIKHERVLGLSKSILATRHQTPA